VSVVIDALDNEEVILLLTAILVLTALAILFAVRRGHLRRTRRTFAVAVSGLTFTALLLAVLPAGGAQQRAPAPKPPQAFYGMTAQTQLPQSEYNRMKKNGVGSFRLGIAWNAVESSPGVYSFAPIDPYVARVARAGIEPFAFLGATPAFYGVNCAPEDCFRSLPSQNPVQRFAWQNFLRACVLRYGPRGTFWAQNPGVPKRPIRNWQIWNEQNFVFFTEPRSPNLYATLVKDSHQAISSVDRGAKVILGGLFGHPKPAQGLSATAFLDRLYRVRGIKASFDGVAIHPYAKNASTLKPDIDAIRRVMKRRGDSRTGLYLTEFGWGSGRDTAFEKGIRGQVRELGRAYTLLRNIRIQARIIRTYWFAWNDLFGSCNFCDSAGLVRVNGSAKPALARFKALARSRR
jgi:hypothetical protein